MSNFLTDLMSKNPMFQKFMEMLPDDFRKKLEEMMSKIGDSFNELAKSFQSQIKTASADIPERNLGGFSPPVIGAPSAGQERIV